MGHTQAKKVAFGGVFAAVALVIMLLGGLVPIATYVCPTLCTLICALVFKMCGKRIVSAWYCAVAILSLLFAPDKEAAAVFVILGYYPIIKHYFQRVRFSFILKLLYFNLSVILLYWILINILGITEIANEYAELGRIGLYLFLGLGNIVFFLLDRILQRFFQFKNK